jgi:peptidoglycan L-alanyl-D-glutamate endopeptidase CwlK
MIEKVNKFSKTSRERLETCHPHLQRLFNKVIEHHDCTIVYGIRTWQEQQKLFEKGASKTLNSKHLKNPETGYSHAADVSPYPINWENTKQFYYFAGIVMAVAKELHIGIRWGGDWDSDNDLDDQNFMDLVHFELKDGY